MTKKKTLDAVVVGAGIGGLACAVCAAKHDLSVLVLEQHDRVGGFTHTFGRQSFRWDVGVHALGRVGDDELTRQLFDWVSEGELDFAPLPDPYDTVTLPKGGSFAFSADPHQLRRDLVARFPREEKGIARYFQAVQKGKRALGRALANRLLPGWMRTLSAPLGERSLKRWLDRTAWEVVSELVDDPELRMILLTQQGYYGTPVERASFALHALIVDHYRYGAYYPVGGGQRIADTMADALRAHGGEVRLKTSVEGIVEEGGRVKGVRLHGGEVIEAKRVVSSIGARQTVDTLLSDHAIASSRWAETLRTFAPSPAHIGLFLGFEGNVEGAGARASNHWLLQSDDPRRMVWRGDLAASDPPALFVSFSSLKDPLHRAGERERHCAEVIALADASSFQSWQGSRFGRRPEEYKANKEQLQGRLSKSFFAHYPRLAPLVVHQELSTPLTNEHFCRSTDGAIYGLEGTPARFRSPVLRPETPLRGFYLSGVDVGLHGITGALISGLFTAAAMDRKAWRWVVSALVKDQIKPLAAAASPPTNAPA